MIRHVAIVGAGFSGTLNATVLYPNYNTTEIQQALRRGAVPPPQPQPVMVHGNLSTGATFNYTAYKVSWPWDRPDPCFPPSPCGPAELYPPRYNFTNNIPSFSWNDTNIAAGGLVMTINLTCGAFVDPDQTPAMGTQRGPAVWAKNALLQGIRASFPASSGVTTGFAAADAERFLRRVNARREASWMDKQVRV